MLSVLSSIDRQYQEILAQNNADIKRLLGLYAQWRGYRATLNELVAKEIGISDGQLHALREFRNKTAWRLFEDSKQDMERAYRKDLSFREREKEIREIRKQLEERFDAALAGELSTEQKHKLEQLKGEKFNLPERLTDYNFPPGRGRRGDDRERDHDNRERKDEDNIKSSPGASDSLLRESPSNEREKNPPCGPPENTRAAISSR
jgi:hypothetical protein